MLRFCVLFGTKLGGVLLGSFLLPLCVIFGTKLGGVLLFRVSFEKGVWLLVSRLGGWLMAQQPPATTAAAAAAATAVLVPGGAFGQQQ